MHIWVVSSFTLFALWTCKYKCYCVSLNLFLHIDSWKWNYLDKQEIDLNNLSLCYKIDYFNNFVLCIIGSLFFQISRVIYLYEETGINGQTINFKFITTFHKEMLQTSLQIVHSCVYYLFLKLVKSVSINVYFRGSMETS